MTDRSMVKGFYSGDTQPEFLPQPLHGERREQIPVSCPMFPHTHYGMHVPTHT